MLPAAADLAPPASTAPADARAESGAPSAARAPPLPTSHLDMLEMESESSQAGDAVGAVAAASRSREPSHDEPLVAADEFERSRAMM